MIEPTGITLRAIRAYLAKREAELNVVANRTNKNDGKDWIEGKAAGFWEATRYLDRMIEENEAANA